MEKRYITVAEFAAREGKSPQAVYKAIRQGKLNRFVNQVDNRYYIDIQAFKAAENNQLNQPVDNQLNQPVNQENGEFAAILAAKEAHIKSLEKQLQEATNQIQFLQQQLERQTVIIEKQLHLQAHTQQLLEDPADGQTVAAPEPAAAPAATPEREKPARGFFRRLIKK